MLDAYDKKYLDDIKDELSDIKYWLIVTDVLIAAIVIIIMTVL